MGTESEHHDNTESNTSDIPAIVENPEKTDMQTDVEGTSDDSREASDSLICPSYIDSLSSTDSRTALLHKELQEMHENNTADITSDVVEDSRSNQSSFWDLSNLGHEIEVKMIRREHRNNPPLESVAYIDSMTCPSPDVSRLRSVCRNAVQSLSREVVFRSMSVLEINEKGSKDLRNDQQKEDVEIEVEEIGYINNHIRNLVFLSLGITLMNISISSLRNLQSSLNHEGGIGIYSLAASFGAFTVFSMFSPFVIQRFRPKACLVVGLFTQLLYVVANVMPVFYLFIPASFLQGIGNSLVWNSMSTYTSYLARASAIKHGKKTEDVASKYFGIFFFFYQLSIVIGNLISSLILLFASDGNNIPANTGSHRNMIVNMTEAPSIIMYNSTTSMPYKELVSICGSKYCHSFKIEEMHVDEDTSHTLIGVYGMAVVFSLVLVHMLLDPVVTYQSTSSSCQQIYNQVTSVFKCLVDRKFIFVTLILMYTSMQVGFAAAEITKAFVTCPLGIYMVGYTMMGYGVFGGLSSYVSGLLAQYVGRVAVISTAATIDLVLLIFMSLWELHPGHVYVYFILLGAWGFADGIWVSQANCIVSALFPDKLEEAFAASRVLQGLGVTIVFCYANSLCMQIKMYILASVCVVGTALYIIVEVREKKSKQITKYDYTDTEKEQV